MLRRAYFLKDLGMRFFYRAGRVYFTLYRDLTIIIINLAAHLLLSRLSGIKCPTIVNKLKQHQSTASRIKIRNNTSVSDYDYPRHPPFL